VSIGRDKALPLRISMAKVYVVTYLDQYEHRVIDVKLFAEEGDAERDYNRRETSWRIRKDIDIREVQ